MEIVSTNHFYIGTNASEYYIEEKGKQPTMKTMPGIHNTFFQYMTAKYARITDITKGQHANKAYSALNIVFNAINKSPHISLHSTR